MDDSVSVGQNWIDKVGGRQMRSILIMPSDELAGDAERRVPLPLKRRKANAFSMVSGPYDESKASDAGGYKTYRFSN